LEEYCIALPKPKRDALPSLSYTIKPWAELFWSRSLEGYYSCPKRLNEHAIPLARYPRNTLGSITYILKLGGILHNPTKTYKGCNTLSELHYKHHGLNYFGLGY